MPRERRGEEKRVNRAKAGVKRGGGGTDVHRDSALCLFGGRLHGVSLSDCLRWAKAAKGMTGGTGGQQDRTASRSCMVIHSPRH